ncbi:MAG: TRAP transporter small permease [Burkholderiales bacterium]|nr:TRAP transporter small permease [Burkholderiales bacterium]
MPEPDGRGAFERVLIAVNRWLIVAMMAAMVALVFANVVSRYVFGYSIIWAEELSQYLMVSIAFVGAGLALRQGRHVAVELLQDAAPSAVRAAIRIAVGAAMLVFMAAVAVLGFQFARFAWSLETPVMQIPLGIPYAAVPVGAALFLVHFAFFFRDYVARRYEEPERLEPAEDVSL